MHRSHIDLNQCCLSIVCPDSFAGIYNVEREAHGAQNGIGDDPIVSIDHSAICADCRDRTNPFTARRWVESSITETGGTRSTRSANCSLPGSAASRSANGVCLPA